MTDMVSDTGTTASTIHVIRRSARSYHQQLDSHTGDHAGKTGPNNSDPPKEKQVARNVL